MTIFERIAAGEFENRLPYPEKVPVPNLLKIPAGKLTHDELSQVAKLKDEFEKSTEVVQLARRQYDIENGRLSEEFFKALAGEISGNFSDQFVQKMLELAWDWGHANGHSEVAAEFHALIPLYELYAKATKK